MRESKGFAICWIEKIALMGKCMSYLHISSCPWHSLIKMSIFGRGGGGAEGCNGVDEISTRWSVWTGPDYMHAQGSELPMGCHPLL